MKRYYVCMIDRAARSDQSSWSAALPSTLDKQAVLQQRLAGLSWKPCCVHAVAAKFI